MPRPVQRRRSPHSNNRLRHSQGKLRLNLKPSSTKLSGFLPDCYTRLPELTGSPIYIRFESRLTAQRGKLLSQQPHRGTAVHAASFLRKREVVIDSELVRRPRMLRQIVIHELFHFVWMRLGNKSRTEFAQLLTDEHMHRARGELGDSAAMKKSSLEPRDCLNNSRRWRDYVCESFCDTAGWRYAGVKQKSASSLASRWRKRRELWFNSKFAGCSKC
jgi:hypothetical protein